MTKGFIIGVVVFVVTLFGGIYHHDLHNMAVAEPLMTIAPVALAIAVLSEGFQWLLTRRAAKQQRIDS